MFDFDVITGPISARPVAPSVKPPAPGAAPAEMASGRERSAAAPGSAEAAVLQTAPPPP
jgi:hypothetical protein